MIEQYLSFGIALFLFQFFLSFFCFFFFDGPKLRDLIDIYAVLQIASLSNLSKSSPNAFCLRIAPSFLISRKVMVTSLVYLYKKK